MNSPRYLANLAPNCRLRITLDWTEPMGEPHLQNTCEGRKNHYVTEDSR